MSDNKKVSIIIPSYFEEQNELFWKSIKQLSSMKSEVEVIVADGGSQDLTLKRLKKFPVKVIVHETQSRAERMNIGAKSARGVMLFFHHPRTVIDTQALDYLVEHCQEHIWGGLTHQFDRSHPLLKSTSWYSNFIRLKRKSVVYLDHCLFCPKSFFDQIAPLPLVDIFEDTILSYRLRKLIPQATLLPYISLTSAIRFNKNGLLKQFLVNQYMKILFHLGREHKKINKVYEKKVSLNTQYRSK